MTLHTLSATELLAALGAREISSVEIVRALTERADAVGPALNCFALRLHDKALLEAEAADAARRGGGELGRLHGLPITVKENLALTGTDATMGIKALVGRPASEDAVVVAALRRAGAIVLGKTNVPQLLLAQETENDIWGLTPNPWNTGRSSGGSSGGEAAAIASGASPCGVGTDIGGSIRIPAHFCGIAGLKPTVDRLSNRGSSGASPGQEMVRSQVGPMARTVADLVLLMQAIDPAALAAWDPGVPPLPLGDPDGIDLRGMRIGWFDDDGYLAPSASLRRAVQRARQVLEEAGAELVPHRPAGAQELIYLWLAAVSADGARTMSRRLDGDPFSRQLAPSRRILKLPRSVRLGLGKVLAARGEARLAKLMGVLGEKTVERYWDLTEERTRLRRLELDLWNRDRLDAVLCPAHAVPAMAHGTSGDFTLSLSYAFRYTFLNFPAGVVPVTRVSQREASEARSDGDRVEKKVAATEAAGAGLPVGVQLIARPYREDVALAVMAAVQRAVRSDPDYPVTPVDPISG